MTSSIKPKISLIFDFIMCILGFMLLLAGISVLVKGSIDEKNYIKAKAEVREIIENEEERKIFVEYEYDGTHYIAQYPYFDSLLDIGDEVDIKFNPNDKTDIIARNKGFYFTSILGIFVGAFVFMYKGFIIISFYKEDRRIKKILEKGKVYQGIIRSVEEDSRNTSFFKTPFMISVEVDVEGKTLYLNSRDIFTDEDLKAKVEKKINVYILDDEFKDYYINYKEIE
ncbi:MAG: hypothetical protein K6E74_00865 [Bacilli bacterium]|nr:hypothetical protein [Bacilli bacterium]